MLKIIRLFFTILILFISIIAYSQKTSNKSKPTNQNLEESFYDAQFFYDQGDYKEALYNYLRIYDKIPENCNINFLIGMCYLKIPGEESKSIPYLEKAITHVSAKYKKNSFTERRAPLHAYFYLGRAYMMNDRAEKALEMFNKFKKHPEFKDNYNIQMVDDEIIACERAKLIQEKQQIVTFTNIGSVINNNQANYKAVLNKDETMIIYMTSLKFYNAIMMSVMKNGQWSEPINITAQIGSDGDCEPSCISFDNKTLYLIRKQKGNNDIYYSEFNGTNWSIMQPLNKNINSNKNESAACISPDGKVLYFSSDRKGGFGNLDLYMSVLDINNEWGPAINLGKNINTPYNDTNPYVCEDGKTFFFCSEGHLNMGGYDIFVTTIFPNYKFDMPINIGYPINTTHDNYYFYPVKNGEFIYLSLIRDEGYGDQDIYKAENISFSKIYKDNPGIVSNAKKVVIRNKITNDIVGYLFGE